MFAKEPKATKLPLNFKAVYNILSTKTLNPMQDNSIMSITLIEKNPQGINFDPILLTV